MENFADNDEACELLKIWFHIRSSHFQWPNAIAALESRINRLTIAPMTDDAFNNYNLETQEQL